MLLELHGLVTAVVLRHGVNAKSGEYLVGDEGQPWGGSTARTLGSCCCHTPGLQKKSANECKLASKQDRKYAYCIAHALTCS